MESDKMTKKTKTISIDSKLLDWVNEQIQEKRFASLSHAIDTAHNEKKEKIRKGLRLFFDRIHLKKQCPI